MIDNLKALAIFATVVDKGSFKAAALGLNLAPSVVSHHVRKLEDNLGVALLYRSTRKLSLTHDGEVLYLSAKNMMSAVDSGMDKLMGSGEKLVGALKITMPSTCSDSYFLTKIADFKHAHPAVDLEIQFTDIQQNIIADGIDLAIRIGNLPDSRLMVKKIDVLEPILMASPDYIATRGVDLATIKHPKDFEDWDFIGIAQRPMNKIFMLDNDEEYVLEYKPSIVVDNVEAAQHMACQGLGIASPPAFLFGDRLDTGELVSLLPKGRMKPVPVHAVWPPNAQKNSLTKRLVNFMLE
ncbi:MAG: LysR family transcriptional regulator [Hyphomicrobiales bacterium]